MEEADANYAAIEREINRSWQQAGVFQNDGAVFFTQAVWRSFFHIFWIGCRVWYGLVEFCLYGLVGFGMV